MSGYTRQSSSVIVNGLTINASDFNNEFNTLQTAFDASNGHAHDGTTGNAPKISLTASVSGILPVANGGTGAATFTANGVILGNTTSALNVTAAGTADQVLRVPGAGGAPAFGAVDVSKAAAVTGILGVANGGTGISTTPSNGFVPIGNGTTYTAAALTAGSNIAITNGAGTISIAATGLQASSAELTALAGLSTTGVLHRTGTATYTVTSVSLTADVSGILPAANGGTGNGFFAVSGPATSTKTFTFPNASATVLTDNALVTAAQGGTNNGFFQVSGPATSTKTFTFPNASATVLTDNAAVTVAQGGTGATTASGARTNLGLGTAATQNTGTSGAGVIPTLDGANTFSALLTASNGLTVTGAGVQAGAPTGGDKGAGTVNATGFYLNGVAVDGFTNQFAHFREEKASGGSTDTSLSTGAFSKRTLNTTKTNTISGCSILSSVITLPAGTYHIEAMTPVYNNTAGSFTGQARLRNTSDTTTALVGAQAFFMSGATGGVSGYLPVSGRFTIAGSKNFQLETWVDNATNTATGGWGSTTGEVQVFSEIKIYKIG